MTRWRRLCGYLEHGHDGPVNLTAPAPVTNREFTKALASALSRPAVLRVPASRPAWSWVPSSPVPCSLRVPRCGPPSSIPPVSSRGATARRSFAGVVTPRAAAR